MPAWQSARQFAIGSRCGQHHLHAGRPGRAVLRRLRRSHRVKREPAKVVAEQVRDALGELRRVRQLTQVELSRTMQRPQSTISRIEREGDLLLSTLAAYVEALGGHLEINAVVGGHPERPTEISAAARPRKSRAITVTSRPVARRAPRSASGWRSSRAQRRRQPDRRLSDLREGHLREPAPRNLYRSGQLHPWTTACMNLGGYARRLAWQNAVRHPCEGRPGRHKEPGSRAGPRPCQRHDALPSRIG